MGSDGLRQQGRRLEDAFFLENDRKLIDQLHKMQKMKEDMKSLEMVSGIKNEAILKKLVELDIRPEIAAAITLVPIIEIAWADGKLDEKEKSAILKISAEHFGADHKIPGILIDEWLITKPSSQMLDAWVHYLKGLVERMSLEETAALKKTLISQAREVAEASGGFLGLNKISAEEEKMLKGLEKAFETKN
ncbi:MAG TPA: hypothetical protein VHO70_24225 [Chitinispirillaceae bacterium]|nr:hypothetical protein [Chitinispirillaceae bacterium]